MGAGDTRWGAWSVGKGAMNENVGGMQRAVEEVLLLFPEVTEPTERCPFP